MWWFRVGHLGFALFFGSLFVKTHRLGAIFNNPNLQRVRMPNSDLLLGLGLLVGAAMGYLCIWTAIDPPVVVTVVRAAALQTYERCASNSSSWEPVRLTTTPLCLLLLLLTHPFLHPSLPHSPLDCRSSSQWKVLSCFGVYTYV